MTPTQITTLVVLFCYFLFLVILNWKDHGKITSDNYAIGSRKVGYIATIGTLALGIRDGAGIILWISFAYTSGYGALWLFAGVLVAFVLMAMFGPRVRKLSIDRDYLTVNQMIRDDIGPYTEKLSALMVLVGALLIMSMQIYVAGNFFSTLLRQPEWIGMVGVAVIVASYLFAGGYSAVIRTNTIQFFWIVSLFVIPFFIQPGMKDVTNYTSLYSMPMPDRIGLFIIGFLYPLAGGDIWQHIFSAKNDKVIHYGFPLAGPILVIMTLSLIFLGFGIKTLMPGANPQTALYDFYHAEMVSPVILSYIAIIIVAITSSTLDSQTYLFTSTAIKNIAPPSVANDKIRYKRWARIVLIGSLVFTTMIALTISNVVQFLFQAVSLLYVFVPVFVFAGLGWFKKTVLGDRLVAITVLISSGIFVWMFLGKMLDQHLILTGVPAGVCLLGCTIVALGQKTGLIKRS